MYIKRTLFNEQDIQDITDIKNYEKMAKDKQK